MAMSNAEKQAAWRERRNKLARLGAAVAAGEAPPILPLPERYRARAARAIAAELVALRAERRRLERRRAAAELADAEAAIGAWQTVLARLLPDKQAMTAAS